MRRYIFVHVIAIATRVIANCYDPFGSQYSNWQECPTTSNKMCCSISNGDLCSPDGLCKYGDRYFRDGCTDPTWSDPGCLRLCMWTSNALLNQCDDGSWCCQPYGPNAPPGVSFTSVNQTCCDLKQGIMLDSLSLPSTTSKTSASIASTSSTSLSMKPSSLSESSLPKSTSSGLMMTTIIYSGTTTMGTVPAAVQTASNDQPTAKKSSARTLGLGVGLGVGLGLFTIALAIWGMFLCKRRKSNATQSVVYANRESNYDVPYHQPYIYEVEGSRAKSDMPVQEMEVPEKAHYGQLPQTWGELPAGDVRVPRH